MNQQRDRAHSDALVAALENQLAEAQRLEANLQRGLQHIGADRVHKAVEELEGATVPIVAKLAAIKLKLDRAALRRRGQQPAYCLPRRRTCGSGRPRARRTRRTSSSRSPGGGSSDDSGPPGGHDAGLEIPKGAVVA